MAADRKNADPKHDIKASYEMAVEEERAALQALKDQISVIAAKAPGRSTSDDESRENELRTIYEKSKEQKNKLKEEFETFIYVKKQADDFENEDLVDVKKEVDTRVINSSLEILPSLNDELKRHLQQLQKGSKNEKAQVTRIKTLQEMVETYLKKDPMTIAAHNSLTELQTLVKNTLKEVEKSCTFASFNPTCQLLNKIIKKTTTDALLKRSESVPRSSI